MADIVERVRECCSPCLKRLILITIKLAKAQMSGRYTSCVLGESDSHSSLVRTRHCVKNSKIGDAS